MESLGSGTKYLIFLRFLCSNLCFMRVFFLASVLRVLMGTAGETRERPRSLDAG